MRIFTSVRDKRCVVVVVTAASAVCVWRERAMGVMCLSRHARTRARSALARATAFTQMMMKIQRGDFGWGGRVGNVCARARARCQRAKKFVCFFVVRLLLFFVIANVHRVRAFGSIQSSIIGIYYCIKCRHSTDNNNNTSSPARRDTTPKNEPRWMSAERE